MPLAPRAFFAARLAVPQNRACNEFSSGYFVNMPWSLS